MITHTMLVSFTNPIPDTMLDQFLADIEFVMRDTGVVETFSAQRHIPVLGEEVIPALVATAVLQFGVADRDALAALLAAPGAGAVIHTWQDRYPYQAAWVNHEALA
jgi:hypothetical protein